MKLTYLNKLLVLIQINYDKHQINTHIVDDKSYTSSLDMHYKQRCQFNTKYNLCILTNRLYTHKYDNDK
jgi:hypothetical protein